ncbi:MAG: pyridoxamine 5'-phosphate oxidase [Rhodomicrobium sp.]|nr:MAG: pyridoxamine 5'-phosphate oxidase [Rhodomicrobium sp.]
MNKDQSEETSGYSSDIAFTNSVKSIQQRKGSRQIYMKMEERGGWQTKITDELKNFIEAQISVFFATANAEGQPYIQHRGGPAGFLKVIDETTIAFADFTGNKQYITMGNLAENDKANLFLIDYAAKRRIKIWGTSRVVEGHEELVEQLMPSGYKARPEQVILFTVSAWDVNCPQHIPQRFEASDVEKLLAERDEKIKNLEMKLEKLKGNS